ncbi:MAG: RNase adapter RapZ [Euzebyales bacterium]|nr:RNase adapter RapZ [Euzebyales bacterium]MDQ3342522.1 RNase adapter RapZ [Actinomycetota bacterium]
MNRKVTVVTGLSGAGRTTAAKVFEDLGYFVIDNVPPSLIEPVVDLAMAPGSSVDRVALVVDARGRKAFAASGGSAAHLQRALAAVAARTVDLRVLFLEASDDALLQRYDAARRVHPLAAQDRVSDGIVRERELLADLRENADLIVDTSDLTVHDLRDRLVDAFDGGDSPGLVVNVVTFGFKNGNLRDADLQLDVRFLPNPHWVDDLRPLTGLDAPVRDFVLGQPDTGVFLERLRSLFDFLLPAYVREGKHYLTIGVGCTGGKHRSVVLGEVLADHLRTLGVTVQVDHRDRGKE